MLLPRNAQHVTAEVNPTNAIQLAPLQHKAELPRLEQPDPHPCHMTPEQLTLNRTRYRTGFLQLAKQTQFTHWLTLNTHRDCSRLTAGKYLRRWRVEMLRLLHGKHFYKKPADLLTWYLGCPEESLAGHPHFHLALVVPKLVAPKFEVIARLHWERIVKSGTGHLMRIGPS